MAKLTLATVINILTSPIAAAQALNNNFAAIIAAFENTLSRDGTTPNQMGADLDLNSNDLLNVTNLGVSRVDAQSIFIAGQPVLPGGGGGGGGSGDVTSVAGRTGDVILTKNDVGLSNVDNTADANKPISGPQTTALNGKLTAGSNLADLTDPSASRVNLGGTTVGRAVFTAANAAAAQTAIAAAPLDSPNFTNNPRAPTVTAGDISLSLANTTFVSNAISNLSSVFQPLAAFLTSIAGLGATGLMVNNSGTASAVTITAAPGVTVTNGNGVAGNPVIGLNGAFLALTDAATIAVDLSLSQNFSVTLSGNRTLGFPTNVTIGQDGFIIVNQDATGSRTLVYSAGYKWVGGTAGTLTTTANARDVIKYHVLDTNVIWLELFKDVR